MRSKLALVCGLLLVLLLALRVLEVPAELSAQSMQARALQLIAERHKVENPIIVHTAEDVVPSTGTTLFKFQAVQKGVPNGPQYAVVLDATGAVVDLARLRAREGKQFFAPKEVTVDVKAMGPVAAPAASISIDPTTNDLTLNPGDTASEVVTVTVPSDAGVSTVDVYFLADATASMGPVLAAVKSGANTILSALNALGLDMAFGVGFYRDFPGAPSDAFEHQLNPTTNTSDVTTAINAWTASGGGDGSEGQLFALDQLAEPPGGSIGWRSGSKRIIVWFGDAPGHVPVCQAISGLGFDITEASVTTDLVAEGISVVAISTTTSFPAGLDDDPASSAGNYNPTCTINGTSGQATRIATATGGDHKIGIDPNDIVNTIIDLVRTAATTINNLSLVPSGATAPFISAISPAAGYGPLAGDEDHTLQFEVDFKGVKPCTDETQVFKGTLDAVADGVVVARKRVTITVPPCEPKEIYSYNVKFVCGVQKDCQCDETVVRPGLYATDINVHNFKDTKVKIEKYVLPVVLVGSPIGRESRFVERKAADRIVLPPNTATMDDCYRIRELLFGGPPSQPLPLTIGFLEIVSSEELSVTAVYTATDAQSHSVSIDVEQIEGKLK
jgi:hypothetical protein